MMRQTLLALSLATASVFTPAWTEPPRVHAADVDADVRTMKIGVPDMH